MNVFYNKNRKIRPTYYSSSSVITVALLVNVQKWKNCGISLVFIDKCKGRIDLNFSSRRGRFVVGLQFQTNDNTYQLQGYKTVTIISNYYIQWQLVE